MGRTHDWSLEKREREAATWETAFQGATGASYLSVDTSATLFTSVDGNGRGG
jgi:hypothetical protein